MNPLESDNKLVTYHSWFAILLLNLQANSRTCVRNGGAPQAPPHYLYLDLSKYEMRYVSRFHLRAHTLAVESSIRCGERKKERRGGYGHCDECS